jgi:hypothetical protein
MSEDQQPRCDIKGPYYPVGDVDWECRTHGVLADAAPGGWKCPVSGWFRVSPSSPIPATPGGER